MSFGGKLFGLGSFFAFSFSAAKPKRPQTVGEKRGRKERERERGGGRISLLIPKSNFSPFDHSWAFSSYVGGHAGTFLDPFFLSVLAYGHGGEEANPQLEWNGLGAGGGFGQGWEGGRSVPRI